MSREPRIGDEVFNVSMECVSHNAGCKAPDTELCQRGARAVELDLPDRILAFGISLRKTAQRIGFRERRAKVIERTVPVALS